MCHLLPSFSFSFYLRIKVKVKPDTYPPLPPIIPSFTVCTTISHQHRTHHNHRVLLLSSLRNRFLFYWVSISFSLILFSYPSPKKKAAAAEIEEESGCIKLQLHHDQRYFNKGSTGLFVATASTASFKNKGTASSRFPLVVFQIHELGFVLLVNEDFSLFDLL